MTIDSKCSVKIDFLHKKVQGIIIIIVIISVSKNEQSKIHAQINTNSDVQVINMLMARIDMRRKKLFFKEKNVTLFVVSRISCSWCDGDYRCSKIHNIFSRYILIKIIFPCTFFSHLYIFLFMYLHAWARCRGAIWSAHDFRQLPPT